MRLVETHNINSTHRLWQSCDDICMRSKLLYNKGIYTLKNEYAAHEPYKNYHALQKQFSSENEDAYRGLNAKISQQTLMLLHQNFKSFFASIKDYATAPEKYKGAPKPPQYKHGEKGRFIATFTNQTFSKPKLKQGIIALSGTDIEIKALHDNVQQVRIVPQNTGDYKVELVYNRAEIQPLPNNDRYAGIDMGLNNLMCVGTNVVGVAPIIINGRPLKSVNQYYNKRRAELNSKLPMRIGTDGKKRQQKTSKRLCRLTQKRNNKIKDYVHKSTRKVVDYLKQNDINTVVIGKNKGWKDEINIGRKNNQNFVSIPHATAINTLSYKLILEGITPIVREESYTSKCSFIDLEPIKKHETNKGRRIKRGLFKASDGQLINADLNAAYNILRKEVPNAYADGIEGLCVSMKHYVVTPLLLQVDVGHGVKLKRA